MREKMSVFLRYRCDQFQIILLYQLLMKTGIDIQRLCLKASLITDVQDPIQKHRQLISTLNETRRTRLESVHRQMMDQDVEESMENSMCIEGRSISKSITKSRAKRHSQGDVCGIGGGKKNQGVGDVDKMVFEKKFKNYLNHKQEFEAAAQRRRERIKQKRKKIANRQDIDDYYDEDEILSNTGSDYQYRDADDMLNAYQTIATGKRKKKGVKLFFGEQFEFAFRLQEYEGLLSIMEQPEKALISKDLLLNYLFDEPMVMMLYSINPYNLGDQLSELETAIPSMLSFQQFSCFLLTDREPTYFQYTKENLQQARKLGRGLKCAPIVAKWIDQTGIYEEFMDIFDSVDMFGNGKVDCDILVKKLKLHAQRTRIMDIQVIQIVNINKLIPVNRILYELEHQMTEEKVWTREKFMNYLDHYYRLPTPAKDKLITKLIMAGKYDNSYIYIVSQQVLDTLKVIFEEMEKFAEFFVKKQKFINKFTKNKKYPRLKQLFVRSQTNRYVVKQTVEQALVRLFSEADEYLDIQEILDFFTNRGRPTIIEYKVYLANLERQIAIIEAEQEARRKKAEQLGESQLSTSSDEQFEKQLKAKQLRRKKQKLKNIHNSNRFKATKKFNVTIPVPYNFDKRDKNKKESIRERKVREMVEQKRRAEDEMMKPIPIKEVPQHVKQNLFEKLMKDQERERQERLQRFRLQILNSMVPMSERLTKPKELTIHCDFTSQPFEFVARPMPWYCEVNLLDRINKKKQERRERILEEIINRHHDNDLPQGVIRMLDRHEALQEKRKEKKMQAETAVSVGGGQCSFIPKISHHIPNFEALHQNLNIDLQIARENRRPAPLQPFSFENRQNRSRTHNCFLQKQRPLSYSRQFKDLGPQYQIKTTQKYKALVEKRKEEKLKKQEEQQEQIRRNQMRKLRQIKFAPQVRRVIKENDQLLSRSRNQLEQKIKQFQREEKKKKRQYQEQMIKIYTKVWNRPLLIKNGEYGEDEVKNSRYEQFMEGENNLQNYVGEEMPRKKESKKKVSKNKKKDKEYEEKRRRVIEQPPGQYLLEDNENFSEEENKQLDNIYGQMKRHGIIPEGMGFEEFAQNMRNQQGEMEFDEIQGSQEQGQYLSNQGMRTH